MLYKDITELFLPMVKPVLVKRILYKERELQNNKKELCQEHLILYFPDAKEEKISNI